MKRIKSFCLTAAAVALLTSACGNASKRADAEAAAEEPLVEMDGISVMQADGVEAIWLRDNAGEHRMKPSLFADADSLMTPEMREAGIPSSISTYLVTTDGVTILFDTGLGEPSGCLMQRFDSLGIAPQDIRYLYLTHLHNDHIGGMMKGDSVVFPNAEVYLSRVEHDAWMAMPAEKNARAAGMINAYKPQLHLFEFGDTLPGNVVAMDAVGHTPGHTAYQAKQLLIVGDLVHGAALQLLHPDVSADYDMDKEQAAKTRKRILEYAAENHLIVAGMHLIMPAADAREAGIPYTIFPD